MKEGIQLALSGLFGDDLLVMPTLFFKTNVMQEDKLDKIIKKHRGKLSKFKPKKEPREFKSLKTTTILSDLDSNVLAIEEKIIDSWFN